MNKQKLIINIIVIIILLLIFDFLFFCILDSKYKNEKIKFDYKYYKEASKVRKFDDVYNKLKETGYLRHIVKTKNNKTIVLFGCSMAYGFLLDKNQSLAYKLSKMSGYNINNQSISSLGIQYFPYILEHFNINDNVADGGDHNKQYDNNFEPQDVKYIIFVMIDNHIYRLYRYFYQDTEAYLDIRYKSNKDELIEIKHKNYFLEHLMIYRYLQNKYAEYLYNKNSFDKNFDFMKLHFLKAQKLVKSQFPNSKIVILKYEEIPNSRYYYTQRWKELENAGFIVLGTYELTGKHLYEKEYRIPNDVHPNEYAWDILVPALVKKLNL